MFKWNTVITTDIFSNQSKILILILQYNKNQNLQQTHQYMNHNQNKATLDKGLYHHVQLSMSVGPQVPFSCLEKNKQKWKYYYQFAQFSRE